MKTHLFIWFIPLAILFTGYTKPDSQAVEKENQIIFKRVMSSDVHAKALFHFKTRHPGIYKALKPQGHRIQAGKDYAVLKSDKMTLIIAQANLDDKESNDSITFTISQLEKLPQRTGILYIVCRCGSNDVDCTMTSVGTCLSVLDTCSDCRKRVEFFSLSGYIRL